MEGVTRVLDPDFLVLDRPTPYARKLLLHRLDPRRQARLAYRTARDVRDFVRAVPAQLTRLFQKMLEGKFAVDFVHQGYEPMMLEIDRSSNRVSFSLIISALIIGSSLIVLSGKGPAAVGVPRLRHPGLPSGRRPRFRPGDRHPALRQALTGPFSVTAFSEFDTSGIDSSHVFGKYMTILVSVCSRSQWCVDATLVHFFS